MGSRLLSMRSSHTTTATHSVAPLTAGVLHEKQTEAEIGQLLQRLQAANLEAEGLNEFERVRPAAGLHVALGLQGPKRLPRSW